MLGSVISLTSNFIAGGALISLLSPLSFGAGILIVAAGVHGPRRLDVILLDRAR